MQDLVLNDLAEVFISLLVCVSSFKSNFSMHAPSNFHVLFTDGITYVDAQQVVNCIQEAT